MALCNLGSTLLRLGRAPEAIEPFERTVQIQPDHLEAWTNLAAARAETHRSAEAIVAAQRALELARLRGQTALAEKLESWLNSYRAGQSGPAEGRPGPKLPPP
jgi:Flp pilus assembly protein TadD